jgi:hypothetical protein
MHVAARERLVVSTDVPSTNACIHGKVDPEGGLVVVSTGEMNFIEPSRKPICIPEHYF